MKPAGIQKSGEQTNSTYLKHNYQKRNTYSCARRVIGSRLCTLDFRLETKKAKTKTVKDAIAFRET